MTSDYSVPANFVCPITCDIMKNPVVLAEDGHSYEKSALELWLINHNTSPITNEELSSKGFVINYNLKSAIEEFCRLQSESKSRRTLQSFTIHGGRPRIAEWRKQPKLQIVLSLLGSSTVGKSCLVSNIEYGQCQQNYRPRVTLGVDVFFFHLDRLFEDEYVVIVQINDCPGNDRFEAVSDRHFRNCHGAILMVDTTNIETLERMQNYWYKQLREKSAFEHAEAILACNKIDLLEKDDDASDRERFFKRADAFASQHQMPMFNISALRGDNIQAMFQYLVSSILQNPSLVKHLKANQIIPVERERTPSTHFSTIRLAMPSVEVPVRNKKSSCHC